MSQNFRLKYDQIHEDNAAKENPNTNAGFPAGLFYETAGPVRNVCFVQMDGTRTFLNYAYLVSGDYMPDANMIALAFTTHIVTLKGIRLETLYYQFMHQTARQVICEDDRYNEMQEENNPIVNQISIKTN